MDELVLGQPTEPMITPISVLKLQNSVAAYAPTVSIQDSAVDIEPTVISVSTLLGLQASDLANSPLLEGLRALTGLLIERADASDTDSLREALNGLRANLPDMPDALGNIRQMVKYAKLTNERNAIQKRLDEMTRQDAMDVNTWEAYGRETGNFGPFLKRAKSDAATSGDSGYDAGEGGVQSSGLSDAAETGV